MDEGRLKLIVERTGPKGEEKGETKEENEEGEELGRKGQEKSIVLPPITTVVGLPIT